MTRERYHRIRYFFVFFNLFESLGVLSLIAFTAFSETLSRWAEGVYPGQPGIAIALLVSAVFLLLYAVRFPQHVYLSFFLDHAIGLSNQSWRVWLADEAKSLALSLGLMVVVVEGFYGVLRVQYAHWWFTLAMAWLVLVVFLARIFPIWIVPLFYPMKKLPENPLKRRLLALMERLSLRVQDLYEIALSRKTKRSNAAVIGFGRGRRIVLGDTLLKDFSEDEIVTVLAHEIAHHKKNHITKSMVLQFACVLLALWLFESLSPQLLGLAGVVSLEDLRLYPVLLFMLTLAQLFSMPAGNALSRHFERQADQFALEATCQPQAFISTMDKLGKLNWADRQPPPWIEWLLFSHPSIEKRIAMGRNFPVNKPQFID